MGEQVCNQEFRSLRRRGVIGPAGFWTAIVMRMAICMTTARDQRV
jgi:hypothetical protein